jgi:GTP-binding protein Era
VNLDSTARSGLVAIVGRPNVGKSTLINALVGEKISIVSSKPHTTRHRILGVLNRGTSQAVFVDTPGHTRRSQHALHRLMARVIHQSLEDCDLAILMIEAKRTTEEDERLFELLESRGDRTILVLNKIDELKARAELLPRLSALEKKPFAAFVPVSAKSGDNLPTLVDTIFAHLPEGPALYPIDMTTNRDLRFRAAEIVREQLFEQLRQEVPYGLTVEIEHMQKHEDGRWLVHALIWLERESHKPIVIGKEGQQLKSVGTAARAELRKLLDGRVHLELWAKVREHWADSEQELQRLGFDSA